MDYRNYKRKQSRKTIRLKPDIYYVVFSDVLVGNLILMVTNTPNPEKIAFRKLINSSDERLTLRTNWKDHLENFRFFLNMEIIFKRIFLDPFDDNNKTQPTEILKESYQLFTAFHSWCWYAMFFSNGNTDVLGTFTISTSKVFPGIILFIEKLGGITRILLGKKSGSIVHFLEHLRRKSGGFNYNTLEYEKILSLN